MSEPQWGQVIKIGLKPNISDWLWEGWSCVSDLVLFSGTWSYARTLGKYWVKLNTSSFSRVFSTGADGWADMAVVCNNCYKYETINLK